MPTETRQIPTQDGVAEALAVYPKGGERHRGVLLYTDVFGVRPVIEAMARELAGHGYYVLVPNLYYRDGTVPVVDLPEHIGEDVRPSLVAKLMPLVVVHTTDRALDDADAYLRFLTAQAEVADEGVAAMGYCMGGVLALRTGAAHPELVSAVAAFHPGQLVTESPDSPHLIATALRAQLHIGHAAGDMTVDALAELDRALDVTGIGYTSEVYPDTIHGFTMADTDAFSKAGLEHHWERLFALLADGSTGD